MADDGLDLIGTSVAVGQIAAGGAGGDVLGAEPDCIQSVNLWFWSAVLWRAWMVWDQICWQQRM